MLIIIQRYLTSQNNEIASNLAPKWPAVQSTELTTFNQPTKQISFIKSLAIVPDLLRFNRLLIYLFMEMCSCSFPLTSSITRLNCQNCPHCISLIIRLNRLYLHVLIYYLFILSISRLEIAR